MEIRDWRDFHWTQHALLRICEYQWKLCDVFLKFAVAEQIEKADWEKSRDFQRHGGFKGLNSVFLIAPGIQYVIKDKNIITVVNTTRYDDKVKNWKIVERDGKRMILPFINERDV